MAHPYTRVFLLIFVVCLVLLVLTAYIVRDINFSYLDCSIHLDKFVRIWPHNTSTAENSKHKGQRRVLFWTPFFGAHDGWLGHFHIAMKTCPSNCTVTTDRRRVKTSDAVIFHLTDLWPWVTMPVYRLVSF
jgi:hypothetical protein